jgi:DNA recombination protein RmuC
MNTTLLILLILGIGVVIFLLLKKKEDGKNDEKDRAIIENLAAIKEQNRTLSEQNLDLRHTIDSKLSETHKATREQMSQTIQTVQGISGQSAKQIADVVAGLTEMREMSKQTNKQMFDFSAQFQNVQDILQNPKRRGILGEYFLESVLKNVLPPAFYQMQFKLGKDDEGRELIVDAVIKYQEKLIPVDSKFSLENYNRILECKDKTEKERLEKVFKQDLKDRIDETSKYIQPKENTTEFALMFIPSEAIYYDLLVNPVGDAGVNANGLYEYACKKRVNIVSANSFYAFLQTIILGLRQTEIEKSTEDIIKRVQKLGIHLEKYGGFMLKLGNSLATTVGTYDKAKKEFIKIDKDVIKIGGTERDLIETVDVDKPRIDE